MTDKIIISRKEIEDAIDTLYIETFSGEPYIAGTRKILALLDKAEVSEPVASEFDKFHKEAYEVRIHQLETANETAKFVIRDKDKELTISVLHNKQLLYALKEACALAGDPRERDYDLIWELLNRTIASVTIYAPPDQSAKIVELEAEIARLKAIIEDMKVIDNVFSRDK